MADDGRGQSPLFCEIVQSHAALHETAVIEARRLPIHFQGAFSLMGEGRVPAVGMVVDARAAGKHFQCGGKI